MQSITQQNNPPLDFSESWLERDVVSRFDFVADAVPDRTAVFDPERSISFRKLKSSSQRLARAILAKLGKNTVTVAIMQENDIDCITSILAVLRAGKRYIVLDPTIPASSNLAIIQHGETELVLWDSSTESLKAGSSLGTLAFLNIHNLPENIEGNPLNPSLGPDSDAAIFYTSGTTGTPKGVLKSHRNFLYRAYIDGWYYRITPNDRVCSLFHNQHSASVGAIFIALLNGASYTPYDVHRQNLHALGNFLANQKITILRSPLTLLRAYIGSIKDPVNLPELRYLCLGGDIVDKEQITSFWNGFKGNYILTHHYALTEAGVIARHNIDRTFQFERETIPLTTFMPFKEVLLLDSERKPVPVGKIGEIAIQSAFLSSGYWADPDQTREKYIPAPDGQRLYLSGDRGYCDADGTLYFAGRKDEQVKIRGHRVNLRIIESILKQQNGIQHPIAAPYKEPHGDVALVACYLKQEGININTHQIRRNLREELPDWMVPSHFLAFDSYPYNAAGKVDRVLLEKEITAKLEQSTQSDRKILDIETTLTTIWEKYLSVSPIDRRDDFFDLGGHSLAAIQIFSEIEKRYGRRLPIGSLLEIRTIENLARNLAPGAEPPQLVVPIKPSGNRLPLFFAPGITGDVFYIRNLLPYLSEDQPLYGLQPPGMGDSQAPLSSIPEIAAELIRAVKHIQPSGPYHLAGHSFGGFYVFEMAQQLIAQGEEVGLLAILDTYVPEIQLKAPPLVRANLHMQNIKGLSPRALFIYLQTRFRNIRIKLLRYPFFKRLIFGLGFSPKDVRTANKIAKHNYRLQPYPGMITYFHISERPDYLEVDPTINWKDYAAGFDLIEMPGQHGTMLDEPHVRELGSALERVLAAQNSRGLSQD
ncbi:MAG: alpha/beta fold hydrolase [Anaerolineales bacterium]|nr:alpha/beta fold hydrolase [Anaerolineales bacterium]